MNNTECIMVTSFKGGVGKSTVTANLALTLALRGKRVLALDCDFNMRCLDLIMGLEDRVVYDICDVCCRGIQFSRAVIQDPRSDNLMFCAAPYNCNTSIDPVVFRECLNTICNDYNFDYVLLDTPGDLSPVLLDASIVADSALIIATHQPASIRAAERTGEQLEKMGIKERRLIINSFDAYAVRRGIRPGIIDIIDRTYVQLIGVIPLDRKLSELQESGSLIDNIPDNDSAHAFNNIAERLEGYSVPLFKGFGSNYKSIILK